MGPYAVSELRLTDLLAQRGVELDVVDRMPLHVTNTLDDPYRDQPALPSFLNAIADSTHRADRIKAEVPVTVVLGNPPYREQAMGEGSWIEQGGYYGGRRRNEDASLMSDFRLPGNGRNEYKLKNMAWYFWRWATWKVFDSPGALDRGVVAFVTTAAYLRGTAFKGMRKYLRRTCDEGWIIDLSPEGMRPDGSTRIFPKVQHTLAVGIFVRSGEDTTDEPARVRYTAVHGRQADKFVALGQLELDGDGWQNVREDWTAPFTPVGEASWDEHPALDDLFPVRAPGVKSNRAWVYSARPDLLRQRWQRMLTEPDRPAKQSYSRRHATARWPRGSQPFPTVSGWALSLRRRRWSPRFGGCCIAASTVSGSSQTLGSSTSLAVTCGGRRRMPSRSSSLNSTRKWCELVRALSSAHSFRINTVSRAARAAGCCRSSTRMVGRPAVRNSWGC